MKGKDEEAGMGNKTANQNYNSNCSKDDGAQYYVEVFSRLLSEHITYRASIASECKYKLDSNEIVNWTGAKKPDQHFSLAL